MNLPEHLANRLRIVSEYSTAEGAEDEIVGTSICGSLEDRFYPLLEDVLVYVTSGARITESVYIPFVVSLFRE